MCACTLAHDEANERIVKNARKYRHAMALHFLYYNFIRIHQTVKMSPAMAVGVTKHLWEMKDVVGMLGAWEATVLREIKGARS